MINFQGRLTDASNNPWQGPITLTFAIYDQETGGSIQWTETHPAVQVVNGVFSVQWGGFDTPIPADVFVSDDRYLPVTVGAGSAAETLSPRQRLLSSPNALNASRLSGLGSAAFVQTGSVDQSIGGTKNFTGNLDVSGQIRSTAAQGIAPLIVNSTTKVSNLNADLLDGIEASAFGDATQAKQDTLIGRIGAATDPAGIDSSLFGGQQFIWDNRASFGGNVSGVSSQVSGVSSQISGVSSQVTTVQSLVDNAFSACYNSMIIAPVCAHAPACAAGWSEVTSFTSTFAGWGCTSSFVSWRACCLPR